MNEAKSYLSPDAVSLVGRLAEVVPMRYLASANALTDVAARWCERQRYWHGPAHLLALVDEIAARAAGRERDILMIAVLYHDAVYHPRAVDNEEASARLLREHASPDDEEVTRRAAEIIVASKWTCMPDDPLAREFFELDTWQLSDGCTLGERLAYERAIFKEFQWAPWPEYLEKRAAFLRTWADRFPQHRRGASECAELLAALQPRIAVYPGSFHPLHLGHLSILRQAEKAFDKVIVAAGVNRQKTAASETLDRRLSALRDQLLFHEVSAFPGLLTGYLDELDVAATVVRGVRDGTDLEAELRFARFLDELRPGTNVVWIACEPELQHLSSSAIRELDAIQPGAAARYVPDARTIYRLR